MSFYLQRVDFLALSHTPNVWSNAQVYNNSIYTKSADVKVLIAESVPSLV